MTNYKPDSAAIADAMIADSRATDMGRRLRKFAGDDIGGDLMRKAADELDRYYTGMMNWKGTAEAMDRDFADLRAKLAAAEANFSDAKILAMQWMDKAVQAEARTLKAVEAMQWQASIRAGDKLKHLGIFEKFEDAVKARENGEEKYHGIFKRN